MSQRHHDVTITLSKAQIAQVSRASADGNGGLAPLFARLDDVAAGARAVELRREAGDLSHSTLRALLLLGAFPKDGTYMTLAEAAGLVGLSPSTEHRYASTWVAVGVLEQEPVTRRYRVCVDGADGAAGAGVQAPGCG